MRPRLVPLLLALALTALGEARGQQAHHRLHQVYQPSVASSQQQQNQTKQLRRPDSSSSFFADIEDLTDSSIRTRQAQPNQPHQQHQSAPLEFDRLIEAILASGRIVDPTTSGLLKQVFSPQQQALVEGFDGQGGFVAADANNRTTMRFFRNNKTFASIVYTNELPRRLINCHLVDLEKHSSDVALFEAKYSIRTVDIEFRDLMQLIDACTNIARLKQVPRAGANYTSSSSSPSASSLATTGKTALQLFAGSLPPSPPLVVVVGRPQAALPAPGASTSLGRFRRRFAGSQYKRTLVPAAAVAQNVPSPGQHTSHALEAGGKRLVLGEVTPPPTNNSTNQPGLREALQEISSYDSSDLLAIWRGILPGTNWCGMGDRATSYNDLGFEADIDICCRAHDFCPIRLSAFTSGYGLFNWSFYTRSHCWCDQNFLDCLQRASSPLSAVVMKFYFNVMKTTCLHDNETLADTTTSLAGSKLVTTWRPAAHRLSKQLGKTPAPAEAQTRQMANTNQEPVWRRPLQHQQHRFLVDQIRASLPIPALSQSKPITYYNEPVAGNSNNNQQRRQQ